MTTNAFLTVWILDSSFGFTADLVTSLVNSTSTSSLSNIVTVSDSLHIAEVGFKFIYMHKCILVKNDMPCMTLHSVCMELRTQCL